MEPYSEFENLPEDIRVRLMYESNKHTINKEYYENELMQHYRYLQCLKPISKDELINTINYIGLNLILVDFYWFDNYREEFSMWNVDTITGEDKFYLSTHRITSPLAIKNVTRNVPIKNYSQIVATNEYIIRGSKEISYNNVLLVPSSYKIVLEQRGDIIIRT